MSKDNDSLASYGDVCDCGPYTRTVEVRTTFSEPQHSPVIHRKPPQRRRARADATRHLGEALRSGNHHSEPESHSKPAEEDPVIADPVLMP
ncbi:hypothetical protein EYF80_020828 [Liparis tanakae]|uniref:Uncharacterized protein n=1 Tax=Liparis tanakae TaxID=230148 RepID=A0A4Z2HTG1_9TELE|nr:hypothetical protein EYF80_020828 [Liparis tanakae]